MDYSDFIASITSEITPDIEFIRKNDKTFKKGSKRGTKGIVLFFIFTALAVIFYKIHKTGMIIMMHSSRIPFAGEHRIQRKSEPPSGCLIKARSRNRNKPIDGA